MNIPAGQPVFESGYNGDRMELQKNLFVFDSLKLLKLDLMSAHHLFDQLTDLLFKNFLKPILTGRFNAF